MKVLFFAAAFAIPAEAESLKCHIVEAKKQGHLEDYVGGSVRTDLESGSTSFFSARGERLEVLSELEVSTWRAIRTNCFYAPETIRYSDGTLRAKLFHFRECLHRVPAQQLLGYVDADLSFDLGGGVGGYREIFKTPSGPVPADHARFEGCCLVP